MIDNYDIFLKNAPETPYLLGRDSGLKSAVLVPFVKIDGTEYVLFEKRASGIRQAGEICFPGGVFDKEKDKDFSETAVRETIEELGISAKQITIDNHLGFLVANMGATVDIFTGRLDIKDKSELKPNKEEVASIHFVPLDFFIQNEPEEFKLQIEIKSKYDNDKGENIVLFPAEKLGLPEKYHNSWRGRKPSIYVYKYNGIIIWGLTANIIREMSDIIKRNK